ncbi:hypothetical protein HK102_006522, partial [Quaeritorhiza haematococci]
MGNGQKAAMRREKLAKAGAGAGKSQLKVNEAAKNVQCKICKQTFLKTVREQALKDHAENK